MDAGRWATVLVVGSALCSAATARAQPADPSQFQFEMHGFVTGTVFMQDGSLAISSGQVGYLSGPVQPTEDRLMLGADVRQSRFDFSVKGPRVLGGATPRAVTGLDWTGALGNGNSGVVDVFPRIRFAYAELDWGRHRLVVGQYQDLTSFLGPVTLMHLGAPYFLTSGNMGFRRPGVFGYHLMGDVLDPDGWKVQLAWEVGRAQWTDVPPAFGSSACVGNIAPGVAPPNLGAPGGAAVNICAGEASALPAFQARFHVSKGTRFSAAIAGHWNRVDRNGAGNIDWPKTGVNAPLEVIGGVAGARFVAGPVTFAGAGFYGKNLAPLYGGFGSLFFTAGPDVREYGLWGQAGWNITREISAWYFLGVERCNEADATLSAAGFPLNRNVNTSGLLQYRDDGFAVGLEWVQFRANYLNPAVGLKIVNQLGLTGGYFF